MHETFPGLFEIDSVNFDFCLLCRQFFRLTIKLNYSGQGLGHIPELPPKNKKDISGDPESALRIA